MNFTDHSKLAGAHAFLSASYYHWLNYDDEKLAERFTAAEAAKRGTELHAFAHEAIRLGQRLPTRRTTMNTYVNDGIGYRMSTEITLFYSENCFGTADSIAFRRNMLRIHDLKTGVTPASMKQLMIYAALFCLEYRFKPFDIGMELRIYQSDEISVLEPDPVEITEIMDKIISFDKKVKALRMEAE